VQSCAEADYASLSSNNLVYTGLFTGVTPKHQSYKEMYRQTFSWIRLDKTIDQHISTPRKQLDCSYNFMRAISEEFSISVLFQEN
jgi:hypothetical protein